MTSIGIYIYVPDCLRHKDFNTSLLNKSRLIITLVLRDSSCRATRESTTSSTDTRHHLHATSAVVTSRAWTDTSDHDNSRVCFHLAGHNEEKKPGLSSDGVEQHAALMSLCRVEKNTGWYRVNEGRFVSYWMCRTDIFFSLTDLSYI